MYPLQKASCKLSVPHGVLTSGNPTTPVVRSIGHEALRDTLFPTAPAALDKSHFMWRTWEHRALKAAHQVGILISLTLRAPSSFSDGPRMTVHGPMFLLFASMRALLLLTVLRNARGRCLDERRRTIHSSIGPWNRNAGVEHGEPSSPGHVLTPYAVRALSSKPENIIP